MGPRARVVGLWAEKVSLRSAQLAPLQQSPSSPRREAACSADTRFSRAPCAPQIPTAASINLGLFGLAPRPPPPPRRALPLALVSPMSDSDSRTEKRKVNKYSQCRGSGWGGREDASELARLASRARAGGDAPLLSAGPDLEGAIGSLHPSLGRIHFGETVVGAEDAHTWSGRSWAASRNALRGGWGIGGGNWGEGGRDVPSGTEAVGSWLTQGVGCRLRDIGLLSGSGGHIARRPLTPSPFFSGTSASGLAS